MHVVSLDIELNGLRRLKSKNKDADVILADARYIPLKDKILDAVFMVEVLDYIPELEITLADCNRALKNRGSIILTFGNKLASKRGKKLQGKSYLHSYLQIMQSLARFGRILRKSGYNWLRALEAPYRDVFSVCDRNGDCKPQKASIYPLRSV